MIIPATRRRIDAETARRRHALIASMPHASAAEVLRKMRHEAIPGDLGTVYQARARRRQHGPPERYVGEPQGRRTVPSSAAKGLPSPGPSSSSSAFDACVSRAKRDLLELAGRLESEVRTATLAALRGGFRSRP